MFKEMNIVFFIISLHLVKDIVTVPLQPSNGQPISQWSGQINGFDTNHNNYVPGNGMGNGNGGNGMGNGNGGNGNSGYGNGMGNGNGGNGYGSNGNSGGNGNDGNGMNNSGGGGNGNDGNGMNNSGFGSNGNGGNGMDNNGSNNGGNNGWNNGSGWSSGWNNGSGWNANGMRPSNVMGDEWSNGLSSFSWSNGTNSSSGSLQDQANQYPGTGYPSMYYQQYSQSFVMPTPANVQDLQNTTAPNPNNVANQMYNGQGGNMGNINNPVQLQGCLPQSSATTASPGAESGSTTESPVTQASTDVEGTTQVSDGSQETPTVASTRKRTQRKH